MRTRRSVHPFGSMVYCLLTGHGAEEWLRLEQNLRVVRLVTQVLVFAGKIVAVELIRNYAANGVSLRRR